MRQLHDGLGSLVAPDEREFRPHVSLLYGRIEEATRRAVVNELSDSAPRGISLGSCRVVDTSGDPDAWVTRATFQLGA